MLPRHKNQGRAIGMGLGFIPNHCLNGAINCPSKLIILECNKWSKDNGSLEGIQKCWNFPSKTFPSSSRNDSQNIVIFGERTVNKLMLHRRCEFGLGIIEESGQSNLSRGWILERNLVNGKRFKGKIRRCSIGMLGIAGCMGGGKIGARGE